MNYKEHLELLIEKRKELKTLQDNIEGEFDITICDMQFDNRIHILRAGQLLTLSLTFNKPIHTIPVNDTQMEARIEFKDQVFFTLINYDYLKASNTSELPFQ